MNKAIEKTTSGEVVDAEIIEHDSNPVKQEMDIDGFIAKRQEFIDKVNKIMVETKDYHVIKNKKNLAKGGAEKIASIFSWQAEFKKDIDVQEAFKIDGLIAFVCVLKRNDQFVGEGRGAAVLASNNGDPNKTIKMAQKSAFVDAVIRASGMSDFFTQDLEDMNPADIGTFPQQHQMPKSSLPPSPNQLKYIKDLMQEKRITEAELIDHGYSPLKDLTGGKEGTASELIEFLKTFLPAYDRTRGEWQTKTIDQEAQMYM